MKTYYVMKNGSVIGAIKAPSASFAFSWWTKDSGMEPDETFHATISFDAWKGW
jgi:hypothetical protein